MKRTFAILIGAIICAAVVSAGDVKVTATLTPGLNDAAQSTTSFAASTPIIYTIFKTQGISSGDKVRGVLIADDVGDVAPPHTKVVEKTLALEKDTQSGDFEWIKPTAGWPGGKYSVEIYVNDKLATTAKFAVPAGKSEKAEESKPAQTSTKIDMSPAAAASLAKPLVELESHTKWSAVDDQWKNLRPGWETATTACTDPQCVAKQMLVLEEHMKWQAVEGDWKKRREGWVSECKSASTEAAVGKLLLELEENMGWQAVDEKWKDRRDGWVAEVKGS